MKYVVACGIDDNYVQHSSVMLMSLSINNPDFVFDIYILSLNVSEESKNKMSRLFLNSNINIHFIGIDANLLSKFPIRKTDYISIASYLRLFLPVVLPESVDKILYLDSDIIINKSIIELLNTDLSNYFAAACLDVDQMNCERLGYSRSLEYYNAGVFFFNIAKIRSFDFMASVLDFVNNTTIHLKYHDQDILNYLLRGKIKTLEYKWNMFECYYVEEVKSGSNVGIIDGLNDTRIIHFTSAFKPWNLGCVHPKKKEYFKFLKLIPWGNPNLHRFAALKKMRLWAQIIILCGGSMITINKVKELVFKFTNFSKN